MSEVWRKDHPEEFEEEPEDPLERIPISEERRALLNLDHASEGAVCAVLGHATSTQRSVDARGKGKPNPRERADQSNESQLQ